MNALAELRRRFVDALCSLVDPAEAPALADLVRPSQDSKFGDYQANCAMPLGKKLGRQPRDVAQHLVDRLQLSDICRQPEIAGPGFINLRLRDEWLAARLHAALIDPRLDIAPADPPRTFVIDYSAPNVAKPMHVGHIRSTVIGDALYRTLKFLGHRVIGDNHLGDWGTQFGMIIYGYKQNPALRDQIRTAQSIAEKIDLLGALYQSMAKLSESDPAVRDRVLAETAALHEGDADNVSIWNEVLPPCLEAINVIYRRLGVAFDVTLGESFYHDRLAAVVQDLLQRGLAAESDGAICVFNPGIDAPMIVRKQDGAFLYGTTDLATIQYRLETWQPDAILYVVDYRQSLHFEQLFATARRWLELENVELKHVSFGTVLGDDGKPYKTRSGDTVGLSGLLDEAVARAHQIVCDNDDAKPDGPELAPDDRARIAEAVGIAALKYADLSQNRTSDYTFSYDKMLAMNGNTATYMQYAYARVRSIFRRGQVDIDALRASGAKLLLATPAERALALQILRFAEALENTLADYRPNQLTAYLFDLGNSYATFFEQCPVLKADTPELRASRLLLCDLTARTLQQGLELLGIPVVEKM